MFLALVAFYHCLAAHVLDKGVAHIGNGSVSVHFQLGFHFGDAVFYHVHFVGVKLQHFCYGRVSLDKLCGAKSSAKSDSVCVILDYVAYCMDTAVNSAVAVVYFLRKNFLFRCFNGCFDKLVNALVLSRRYGYDGYSQTVGKSFDVNGSAVVFYLVHHIQGKYHRYLHFSHLKREIQISLNVCGINNVDYAVGLLLYKKVTGDYLFACVWSDRVYAGKINYSTVFLPPYLAAFFLNGNSGEVAYVLI